MNIPSLVFDQPRWLLPLAAAALTAACTREAPAPEPIRAVRVATVAAGDASQTLEYAAEIRARSESRLGFRVPGKIVERRVDVGASVHAGQVLARLDPRDLTLAEDAAHASSQAAQAQFEQARADFARFQELEHQGFISPAELERRQTALRAAQAQALQARAQAAMQANQAAYGALLADVAGVVTGVDAEPGMVVAAGTPVLRLAHDGPRDAVFSVPEDKAGWMRELIDRRGAVRVQLGGSAPDQVAATVREVAAAADPVTRTFLIKADLGPSPAKLGQTATVRVDRSGRRGVVAVPLAAVVGLQGRASVWLLDRAAMTVRPQPIEVGPTSGDDVTVTAGLEPGQTIVTAGVHVLTPGQKVVLYQPREATPVPAAGARATAAAHK